MKLRLYYDAHNLDGCCDYVMASSATDSSGKDRNIRQRLVESGHMDMMVS